MNETGSIHTAKNWGVVLLSIPSKRKKEIIKNLEQIFKLEKRDAEKILSNAPLILVDDLTFEFAANVRDYFRRVGAVAEATNHEVIKKNYWKVRWPETPDLAFFTKREAGFAEVPPTVLKAVSGELAPAVLKTDESPAVPPYPFPLPDVPSVEVPSSGVDLDWAQRVNELDGKLRKIHREKVEAQEQRAEAVERLQKQLDEEKQKNEELTKKAFEDLHREAEKQEVLIREREEWRFKSEASDAKVRELESTLAQKQSEIEQLIREREEWRSKSETSDAKIRELDTTLAQKVSEIEQLTRQKEDLGRESEKAAAEAQQQISSLRDREQELLRKVEELERNVRQMAESLRFRDQVLAQFEKEIAELAGPSAHPQGGAH